MFLLASVWTFLIQLVNFVYLVYWYNLCCDTFIKYIFLLEVPNIVIIKVLLLEILFEPFS